MKTSESSRIRVYHRCGGCGKKQEFLNSGKFRVNANGNQLDVWLIYQCEKCKHTYNLSVYERIRPGKIPKDLYLKFLANDEETALTYGTDKELFVRNRAEADWEGIVYELLPVQAGTKETQNYHWIREDGKTESLRIHNPYGIPVRADKVLAEILGMSRSRIKKLMQEEKIVPV